MELTRYIANRLGNKKDSQLVVGLCGRAGSGKSTFARWLSESLGRTGVECRVYEGDWRFRHDSETRRRKIERHSREGLISYVYAIHQFGWWDFDEIHNDLARLRSGAQLEITDAYNRSTGRRDARIFLPPLDRGVILFENAILGATTILNGLDVIAFLNTPDRVCLERCLDRDGDRRSLPELLARYLVTSYSENLFLHMPSAADRRRGCR